MLGELSEQNRAHIPVGEKEESQKISIIRAWLVYLRKIKKELRNVREWVLQS